MAARARSISLLCIAISAIALWPQNGIATECEPFASAVLSIDPSGTVIVPASVNGHDTRLALTLGTGSTISPAAATTLGLTSAPMPKGITVYFNRERVETGQVGNVKIGDHTWGNLGFEPTFGSSQGALVTRYMQRRNEGLQYSISTYAEGLAFVPNVHSDLAKTVVGTIGADIFVNSGFELELDLGHRALRFYAPDKCRPSGIFSGGSFGRVNYAFSMEGLVVPLYLDEKSLFGVLSPSMPRSMLSIDAAKTLFSISESEKDAGSVDENDELIHFSHEFKVIDIGGIQISQPKIDLFDFVSGASAKSAAQRRGYPSLPRNIIWVGTPELAHLHLYFASSGELWVASEN